MDQIIEGVDNEVSLILFFTTAALAFIVPLYVARIFNPRSTSAIAGSTSSQGSGNGQSAPENGAPSEDTVRTTGGDSAENLSTNSVDKQPDTIKPEGSPEINNTPNIPHSPHPNTSQSMNNDVRQSSPVDTPYTAFNGQQQTAGNSIPENGPQGFLLKVKVQETSYEQTVNENMTLLELKRYFFYLFTFF